MPKAMTDQRGKHKQCCKATASMHQCENDITDTHRSTISNKVSHYINVHATRSLEPCGISKQMGINAP